MRFVNVDRHRDTRCCFYYRRVCTSGCRRIAIDAVEQLGVRAARVNERGSARSGRRAAACSWSPAPADFGSLLPPVTTKPRVKRGPAVEIDSRLIVGQHLTQATND